MLDLLVFKFFILNKNLLKSGQLFYDFINNRGCHENVCKMITSEYGS